MPAQTRGHISKYLRKREIKRASVLRVLAAVMENQAAAASNVHDGKDPDYHNEFYSTGRIGRRNALPDILGYNCATTTTADLPMRLSALTTNDTPTTSSQASSSAGPSTGAGSNSATNVTPSCSSSTQPIAEAMNTT